MPSHPTPGDEDELSKTISFPIDAPPTLVCALICLCLTVAAQDQASGQKQHRRLLAHQLTRSPEKSSKGRDSFKKYQPVIKAPKGVAAKLEPPSIQVRIRALSSAESRAASAHIAAPKPTTALLLNEVQVTPGNLSHAAWLVWRCVEALAP